MRLIPLKIHTIKEAKRLMCRIGVDSRGIEIMAPKTLHFCFKIEDINSLYANIIKQHLLSLGSDAAIDRKALTKRIKTSLVLFGTFRQIDKLISKLKSQPFELKEIAYKLEEALKREKNRNLIFKARNKLLKIKKPILCGIINVTPDSFSGDGLLKKCVLGSRKFKEIILKKTDEMVKNGAKIIDIGGESTRPYSKRIDEKEEIRRVIPAIKIIRKKFSDVFLSIDTYKYKVAKEAVEYGVDIINDITALRNSPRLVNLIAKYKLGCILMHMKGTPQTMQLNPLYKKGVVEEIFDFLSGRIEFCLNNKIRKDQIMIDPGIGFGKRLQDNYQILNKLYILKSLCVPIFLGVSRKSFIGKVLKLDIEERIYGTISALSISYIKGADVLRVHDVKEAYQALKIAYLIKEVN